MAKSWTSLLVVAFCALSMLSFASVVFVHRGVAETLLPDPAAVKDEEYPFKVGEYLYRDIYLGVAMRRDRIEDNIRRRYGTTPFDLPSAASCLHGDLPQGAEPTNQALAWERLLSEGAVHVCLARVLNRFSRPEAAADWLTAQGLILYDKSSDPDLGLSFLFQWSPKRPRGPLPWWNALSEQERDWMVGLSVMIEVCDDEVRCMQLAGARQSPPYFAAAVQPISKYQK